MTARGRIGVVLADDHPLVMNGMVELLAEDPKLDLLATCDNGVAALRAIRDLNPDVAVIDVNMPQLSGLDLLKTISSEGLHTRIVLLTAELSDRETYEAVEAGASAIIFKSGDIQLLAQAIHDVAAGRKDIADDSVRAAVARETERREKGLELWKSLTQRERDIAVLAARDLPNKEIGRVLDIVEGTVKIHLHNIYLKLRVANRDALTVLVERFQDQMPPNSGRANRN